MSDRLATYEIRLKDNFSQGFKKLDSRVDRFDNKMDRLGGSRGSGGKVGGLSSGLSMLGRAAVGLGAALGVGALGGKIVKLGVDMEQTRVSFATMFGTVEKGNEVIERLNNFANVTPFDNAKVIQAAKSLAAFGVEADELEPTLKLIGDVSAGTGKDLAEMGIIFGQIKSAGRLMGQDLLQLINAGFNPLQEISRKTGKSVADLKDEMSKGNITFEDVKGAFEAATSEGGKFFNLMEKQSQTVGGRFSTLLGKLQMIGIKIGEALLPVMGKVLDFTLKIVDQIPKLNFDPIVDTFREWESSVQTLFQVFDDLFEAIGMGNTEIFTLQNVMDTVAVSFRIAAMPLRLLSEGLMTMIDIGKTAAEVFAGFGKVINGALTLDAAQIQTGITQATNAIGQGFDKIKARATEFAIKEGKFALSLFRDRDKKSIEELRKGFEDNFYNAGASDSSGGLSTTSTASGGGSQRSSTQSGVSGSAPRNVTLNITKLVEQITFQQNNFEQNKQKMVEEIKRALLVSLNDVVIQQQ